MEEGPEEQLAESPKAKAAECGCQVEEGAQAEAEANSAVVPPRVPRVLGLVEFANRNSLWSPLLQPLHNEELNPVKVLPFVPQGYRPSEIGSNIFLIVCVSLVLGGIYGLAMCFGACRDWIAKSFERKSEQCCKFLGDKGTKKRGGGRRKSCETDQAKLNGMVWFGLVWCCVIVASVYDSA